MGRPIDTSEQWSLRHQGENQVRWYSVSFSFCSHFRLNAGAQTLIQVSCAGYGPHSSCTEDSECTLASVFTVVPSWQQAMWYKIATYSLIPPHLENLRGTQPSTVYSAVACHTPIKHQHCRMHGPWDMETWLETRQLAGRLYWLFPGVLSHVLCIPQSLEIRIRQIHDGKAKNLRLTIWSHGQSTPRLVFMHKTWEQKKGAHFSSPQLTSWRKCTCRSDSF